MNVKHAVGAAIVLAITPLAKAQLCTLSDTRNSCLAKVVADFEKEAIEAAEQKAGDDIARRVSGISPSLPQSVNGTVNDFLSRFQFIADTGQLSDDRESYTFELSRFLPAVDGLKLALTLNAAEPYVPLLESVSDDDQPALIQNINEALGDFDDVNLTFAYTLNTRRFGRDHQTHADLIGNFVTLTRQRSAAVTREQRDAQRSARTIYQDALTAARAAQAAAGQTHDPQGPFSQFGRVHGPIVRSAAELRAISEAQDLKGLLDNLDGGGFGQLVDLIDNQPQLYIAASLRQRDDLAGPDEFRLRIAYEMGLQNLNSLRRHAARSRACGKTRDLESSDALIECLNSYLDKVGSQIDSGRFLFSAEVLRRQALSIVLDRPSAVAFDQASFNDTRIGAAYGRYFPALGAGDTEARLDFGLSYEDVDGDPTRNDRAFAELTFSRRITEGTFLTLGLVYSNKPEYRGPVDQELSARLGFNYKIHSFAD